MWLHTFPSVDQVLATDASKKGFGGILGEQYFRGRFPQAWQNRNIAGLEIRAVIVALKIWGAQLRGKYFWVHVDNEAIASIINTGASKDKTLQNALREITMLAAKHEFIIKAKHISGVSNRIPDWLSRWSEQEARRRFHKHARDRSLVRCKLIKDYLEFNNKW